MPVRPVAWTAPITANPRTAGAQTTPRTVQLTNGEYWVAWTDADTGGVASPDGRDIVGQRFSALGVPIGGEVRLNANQFLSDEQNPRLAASLDNAEFFITYEDLNVNGNIDIILERKGRDGTQLRFSTLANDPTNDATGINFRNPEVAIGSLTNGMAVFERSASATRTDIVGQYFNATTGDVIGANFTILESADRATDPQVVTLANGNYVVVWRDEVDGNANQQDIRGALVSQSGVVGAPFTLVGTTPSQREPSITALANGGFVLAFTDSGPDGVRVGLAAYTASGVLVNTVFFVTAGPNSNNEPEVVATNDGGVVVMYENDSLSQIVLRSFNSSLAAVGAEVIVAPLTSGSPLSLLALRDGRVLATYSDGEIRTQIFDPRAAPNVPPVYAPESFQIGTPGNDNFQAAAGARFVHGGTGNDTISKGDAAHILVSGDGGDDSIIANFIDSVAYDGGPGTDLLQYTNLAALSTINLASGVATNGNITQSITNFENFATNDADAVTVIGTDGSNSIQTGAGADTINGGLGNDTLDGGLGNDTLNGGAGADAMSGGGGDDSFVVDDAGDTVIELAGQGNDIVSSKVSYSLASGQHVELLLIDDAASTTALNLAGNAFGQGIAGNAGANFIAGRGGADTLIGRGGDDSYLVTDAAALVWEDVGGGSDTVFTTVSYTLEVTREIELLLIDDAASTTALNLTGNEFAQVIAGNAGANFIAGRGGADILIGRGGDDSYLITDAAALVWEDVGEGNDSVFTTVSYTLEVTREIERLLVDDAASTTALNLTGNEFAQVVAGNAGANFIAGRGGADILIGRGGNDSYLITDAAARVWEDVGGGSDTVFTTVSYALETTREIERLVIDDAASSNALNLTGNEFAQVVAGNAGANVLDGKGGADTLVGRGGADSFAFTTTLGGGNVDWIFDFELVTDQILLDDAVFTGLGLGALSANAFVIGSAAADADDRIIYNSGTGALFFDADGAGGAAAVQFATMSTGLALTASEFTVI